MTRPTAIHELKLPIAALSSSKLNPSFTTNWIAVRILF